MMVSIRATGITRFLALLAVLGATCLASPAQERGSSSEAVSIAPNPDYATSSRVAELGNYQGQPVSSISFRGVSESDASELLKLIPQKNRQPLDRGKVRDGIRALFATGRFANLSVEVDRGTQNQLSLVFVAEENLFVGAVTVSGRPRKGPTTNQLISASKLELGQLFTA